MIATEAMDKIFRVASLATKGFVVPPRCSGSFPIAGEGKTTLVSVERVTSVQGLISLSDQELCTSFL